MRNISQTIFNIDKMEKIIKTLPELKSIIDANKFHTFDYTEGLSVSDGIEIFEIDIEETDEIEVVTNLFLPTPPPEGYHIQLTGNYDEDEHAEWQQFLDENQWKIYPIARKYHTGIFTKRRRCIIPTVIYPISTRVHISNC